MMAFRTAAAAAMSFLSFSAAQSQPAAPVRVVNLASYYYAPAPIVLAAGRPVTLRFVNRAGKGHDFTATRFFRSSRILAGHVESGEVDLRPGEVANVTLIPAAGRYKAHCSHPFHKMFGMRTTVIVQ
jgi:plastocyanin